ncbi:hypothetical protein [Streptomyces sp. NPDC006971]|uniref:hypothetical protein n=1 Tax=Streptomyces sp. NPDC006971 TaxID=3154784 RepID=UPI0033F6D8A8
MRYLRQEGNVARSGINKREIDKWARNLVKETNKSLERAQRRNLSCPEFRRVRS